MAQEFLHNLPRIDHSFNEVSNDIIMPSTVNDLWKFDTNEYQQSIQMFFIIPIIIGFIYAQILMLIMVLYCCFGCFKNKFEYGKSKHSVNNEHYQPLSLLYKKTSNSNISLTKYSKIIRIIIVIIILIILIFVIIYGESFNKSIVDISSDWYDSYNKYYTIVDDSNTISTVYIPDAQIQCDTILNTPSAQPIYDNIMNIQNVLTSYQSNIDQFLFDATGVPDWGTIHDDIKPYREFIIIFPIIMLIFYGLLSILNYGCYAYDYLNSKCCCCCFSFLIIYIGLLIFSVTSLQFSVSIQISDGCVDPHDSIWKAVSLFNNNNNNSLTSNDIIYYYLYCDQNSSLNNPLFNDYNSAYDELASINDSIYILITTNISTQYEIEAESKQLIYDYNQSLNLMLNINNTIKCETIHYYTDKMTNTLCGDSLDYWLIYYLFQYLFIILFIIRSCCICTYNKNGNVNNNNHNSSNSNNYGGTNDIVIDGELELVDDIRYNNKLKIVNQHSLIDSDSESDPDNEISINIKMKNENIFKVNINQNQRILDLMNVIQNIKNINIQNQTLIFNQNQLDSTKKISDYLIDNESIINLIVMEESLDYDI